MFAVIDKSLILQSSAKTLQDAGIERPWRELRHLVADECCCRYEDVMFFDVQISDQQLNNIRNKVNRRANHEPLSKILGKVNFWKHVFCTTKDTLDPRPEGELFVETVLEYYKDQNQPITFLDLGTGTGCLLLSCLSEYCNAIGVGVDICEKALLVARQNATNLGIAKRVSFYKEVWNNNIHGVFDVILCNPPYIKNTEKLPKEVLWDPAIALFGGDDGLRAYQEIFPMLRKNIHENSKILIEIGVGQQNDVCKIATTEHFQLTKTVYDLQNIPRVLVFRLSTVV
ncbi:MAG: peptide chain release factor N(5)-glutamine methyltransferase [Holosporales bacterium]|jgi:release factor glutamine methyltransferase|nr:peptide chain release factor N(5)-glutamine methyltransferase [Holosporales bacterium]